MAMEVSDEDVQAAIEAIHEVTKSLDHATSDLQAESRIRRLQIGGIIVAMLILAVVVSVEFVNARNIDRAVDRIDQAAADQAAADCETVNESRRGTVAAFDVLIEFTTTDITNPELVERFRAGLNEALPIEDCVNG